jgi:hypothetical protein
MFRCIHNHQGGYYFDLTKIIVVKIVDSDKSAKGIHCCFSMATIDTRPAPSVMLFIYCSPTTVKREYIVAFPWQQLIHGRPPV